MMMTMMMILMMMMMLMMIDDDDDDDDDYVLTSFSPWSRKAKKIKSESRWNKTKQTRAPQYQPARQ